MKVLYFAHFREKTGISEEEVDLPEGIQDVTQLIDWLATRDEGFEDAFRDRDHIRVAVNQEHVEFDVAVGPNDEIAFFPPMTGG